MKCKCIWISLSSSELVPFTYCINGSPVDSVPHYRDLGVHFSNDLSWTYHHSTIISKAYNTLHFLRRTMSPRHSSATRPRHSSLVWSNLAYSSQVWRLHLLKDIRSIERVQRWSTKFILNDYASDYKLVQIYFHSLYGSNLWTQCFRLIVLNILKNTLRFFFCKIHYQSHKITFQM